MPFTPDDIAKRSFTPSADGYHQGEVREFLARVATERRAILTSMPENQRQVSELTVAIANHEQRLHLLERRLQATLDQLDATADALQKTQDRASQQLAAARKVTAEQQELIVRFSTQTAPKPTVVGGQPMAVAAPSAPAPAATPPRTGPAPVPAVPPRTVPAPLPAVPPRTGPAPLPTPPPTPAPLPTPPPAPLAPLPRAASAPVVPPRTVPAPTAATPTTLPPAGLLEDLDKQPLISDSANDLLDNVLGDIMGDITERPDA